MQHRTVGNYTLLISCRGRILVHHIVKPWLAVTLGLGVFAPLLTLGILKTINIYQQNQELSKSADEVLEQLESLDREIENLNQRAGLKSQGKTRSTKVPASKLKPQGGPAQPLPATESLATAKQLLPSLTARLQHQIKPALEKTLQKEAARAAAYPNGYPVSGILEISSDFGIRPGPFGGAYEHHDGIDILGPYGTPIYAVADGVVERASYAGGYGNLVSLKHGYGYETLYAHLSKLAVAPKQRVKRGDVIGFMGNTGRSTGTHLHYSVYLHKKAIDPKDFLKSERLALLD